MTELTPNDVVSLNMAYYRKAAGLSQQELADQVGWLKSVVSTAERSWGAKRKRYFTANDIAGLAAAFGIPVGALFVPPPGSAVSAAYPLEAADPESPAMGAYRKRLAAAGNHDADFPDLAELSRRSEAFREYCREEITELADKVRAALSR